MMYSEGAYDVEVLVPALNFGEHDFVDIEHLVDDTEVFARLLLVPVGKFGKHIFIDVVRPVVYLQYTAALFCGVSTRREGCDTAQ